MMDTPPAMTPGLAAALERYRARDLTGARAAAAAAIAGGDDATPLRAFAGLIACQAGDTAAGADHLRLALAAIPADLATRTNLVNALVELGDYEEAAGLCEDADSPKLKRLAGYCHQQLGRHAEAARDYADAVAAMPDDWRSWNNLGNARSEAGDGEGAIAALKRAIALRGDTVSIHVNLAKTLAKAERYEEQREVLRVAARIAPSDAEVLSELGLAEASTGDLAAAERAFRAAIAVDPQRLDAHLELGLLLENLNRIDDFAALVAEAEERSLPAAELDFLKAWLLRRQHRFAEALPLAERAADTINPVRRHQLIAELRDRTGDPDGAFAAYRAMNEASVRQRPHALAEGRAYLDEVLATGARTTPLEIARWTLITPPPSPPPPIFVVGFPRSGTTLLDTLLMNLPELHVLEEQPILYRVEQELGDPVRLGSLSEAESDHLRALYFETLSTIAPPGSGQTIVDKFPLHMARMPLIHRLFPDSKVVFVERHPCDSVLSSFMANFQLNRAMANLTTLKDAATLYAAAQEAFTRAISLLPIAVHRIRYERMVDDLESEMRPLLAFLGLEWDAGVLQNEVSAARRPHIRTASYSQVTEPIYRRATGRWLRYRDHMSDVLPLLAPWIEQMGYEV